MLRTALAVCLLATPAFAAPPSPPERPEAGPADTACRGKTTCEQMESCEEAYFHYKRCGASALDSDRDGIPCENLCR
ncbi:MAG: excalibur calcium-binding domain-containing protein [Zavarzinia sp.]|nr:excalibur calcium-binding domain-containing protein [Zavarzinia sp.]